MLPVVYKKITTEAPKKDPNDVMKRGSQTLLIFFLNIIQYTNPVIIMIGMYNFQYSESIKIKSQLVIYNMSNNGSNFSI